jgi:P4 family phage/plasmid primase-like protien
MLEQGWLCVADLTESSFLSDKTPSEDFMAGTTAGRKVQRLEIGSDAEIACRVAKDLTRRLGPVVYDEGEFWHHNRLHWQAIPSEALWRAVFVYDGAGFDTPKDEPSNVKLSQGRVESVLACMKPLLSHRRFFVEAAAGINCSSGFITLSADGAASLASHSPDHRQRHVIAGHWPCSISNDEKASSLLHRLLHGCFQGDQDKRGKMDLLAEVAGIAALGHATRIVQPKALVCVGKQAENGKSQVLAMLRSLLPKSAVSAISPARFDDRTFACHLVGKLLNAPDELAGTEAVASEIFKQIITGEPIMARDVYRSAFEFEPCAQHVFATNALPTFKGGMDRGIRRRLLVLTFNRVIPKGERLERIGQRVGEEEADLLLDWAVRGAARVIAAQAFTTPASSDEALRDWMYSSDPVLAWLESDEIEFRQEGYAPETKVSMAHDRFVRWAGDEGFGRDRLPAVNGFSQRVEAAGKGVTKNGPMRAHGSSASAARDWGRAEPSVQKGGDA